MSAMERDAIRIHPQDNVAVALRPLAEGEAVSVDGQAVRIQEEIPFGHKVALTDLADGAMVVKYGAQIGHTTQAVPSGAWLPMAGNTKGSPPQDFTKSTIARVMMAILATPRLPQVMATRIPARIRDRIGSSSRCTRAGISSGSMWLWSSFWRTFTILGSSVAEASLVTTFPSLFVLSAILLHLITGSRRL